MKRIGVREFRDHATKYLAADEPIEIERHGRPIGHYIPIRRTDEDEVRQAVTRLAEVVEHVLAGSGMTEDELAALFDLRQPV